MIPFTKLHGIGNDYIYINAIKHPVKNPKKIAIEMSNRHFGVGSDGLILILPSKKADFKMRMFNADGSEAEMCGNGVRCVAKYVHDHGIAVHCRSPQGRGRRPAGRGVGCVAPCLGKVHGRGVAAHQKDPAALVTGRELGVFGPASVAGLAATQDVAVAADWVLERGFALAGLDCGGCGKASCAELAQAIVAGQARPQECVAQVPAVRVRCGGRDLALGPFVERLVQATLRGLLSELKGYVPGQPVRIEME